MVAVVAAVLGLVGAEAGAQPLPTDPRLVRGELENGLQYVVLKHPRPEGRAELRLLVRTGSLNERDTQRGLAHYLEHMAFNGTANFPPGSVVGYFESIGMRFGADLNASTGMDQTVYQLSLPRVDEATIGKGLLFLSDVALRQSLLQEEIERERRIILNEKMSRSSAGQRLGEYVLQRIAPGSLVGERITIGTEESIRGVQRPDFVDYYERWYVPSNMAVVVVADAPEWPIVEQVRRAFADGKRTARPAPQDPRITPYSGSFGIVATDPEIETASIQVARLLPAVPPTTTEAEYRRDLVVSLGTGAFNRRMGAKISRGGTPFLSAGAGVSSFFRSGLAPQARCSGKPDQWREMLAALGAEVQRARLHGFTAREVDDVRAERLSSAEEAVRTEGTRPASIVVRMLTARLGDEEPILSAQQELDLLRRLLPTITPEEVSRAFAEHFEPVNVAFVVQLPSSAAAPTEAELVSLGTAALAARPEAEAEGARATALLAEVPKGAAPVEASEHAASGVWSAWLPNGVRVHHRAMDAQKDQVTVTITLAGGTIQETAANRGITSAAEVAWSRPATSRLSSTDIRDLMTGKKARLMGGGMFGGGGGRGGRGGGGGGGGGLDTLVLRIAGSPEDLEPAMQLAYLMLTDPVIEPAAFEQWRTRQLQQVEAREKSPAGAFATLLAEALYPAGESRLRPLTAEQVNAVTLEAAQGWLRTLIAGAPIEVSIVGDLPRDRAVELASRYLGSLPARERIGPGTLEALRHVERPPGPVVKERTIGTRTNQAIVRAGFFGPEAADLASVRAMELAARIISTRMVRIVREERNLVYSIGAAYQPSRSLPGYGMFSAGAPAEPGNADALAATIREIFDDFARGGPSEEELAVAKRQIATELERTMKEPAFWAGLTQALDYRGQRLDDAVGAPAAFEAITGAEVRGVFARYCKPEGMVTVVLRPAPGGPDEPAPASAPGDDAAGG
jgi:zinc protease